MNYKELAQTIVEKIGGSENVTLVRPEGRCLKCVLTLSYPFVISLPRNAR